jgi:periplasmic protein CpxP/Spy
MKKRTITVLALMFAITLGANAQGGGGFQRRTVEERVQIVHTKIDSAFKLEAATQAKVDTAFAAYYRSQDKIREELMSGGERPDMQVMREKMQPATDTRDKELKTLLGDDKYKIWKEQLEPSLRPQRRNGGGGQ